MSGILLQRNLLQQLEHNFSAKTPQYVLFKKDLKPISLFTTYIMPTTNKFQFVNRPPENHFSINTIV